MEVKSYNDLPVKVGTVMHVFTDRPEKPGGTVSVKNVDGVEVNLAYVREVLRNTFVKGGKRWRVELVVIA